MWWWCSVNVTFSELSSNRKKKSNVLYCTSSMYFSDKNQAFNFINNSVRYFWWIRKGLSWPKSVTHSGWFLWKCNGLGLILWSWVWVLCFIFRVFLIWSAFLVFFVFCWCNLYFLFYSESLSFLCWGLLYFLLFLSLVCSWVYLSPTGYTIVFLFRYSWKQPNIISLACNLV